MRKLLGYLIGLLIMLGVFASLYLAGAIYDTSDRITIEPYFLRQGLLAADQVGKPQPLSEVQNKKLKVWLIQKYVHEYLYIEPGEANIEQRMAGNSVLAYMSTIGSFEKWKNGMAKKIQEAARNGIRRTVYVYDEILSDPDNSDYLRVDYETKTWYKPNDMNEVPTVKHGTMYLNVEYTGQLYKQIEEIQDALRAGKDPAIVFVFYVTDAIIDEK
jgi:hypothetical protein